MVNDYEGFENPGEERYNRLAAMYVVDFHAESNAFRQLRIVPMFMNRLRLERFTPASRIWRPQKVALEHNPNKGKEFGDFINHLSLSDAGGGENALQLKYCDTDPQIPGGPILKTKIYPSGTASSC
jgi:hypothetical protein